MKQGVQRPKSPLKGLPLSSSARQIVWMKRWSVELAKKATASLSHTAIAAVTYVGTSCSLYTPHAQASELFNASTERSHAGSHTTQTNQIDRNRWAPQASRHNEHHFCVPMRLISMAACKKDHWCVAGHLGWLCYVGHALQHGDDGRCGHTCGQRHQGHHRQRQTAIASTPFPNLELAVMTDQPRILQPFRNGCNPLWISEMTQHT